MKKSKTSNLDLKVVGKKLCLGIKLREALPHQLECKWTHFCMQRSALLAIIKNIDLGHLMQSSFLAFTTPCA